MQMARMSDCCTISVRMPGSRKVAKPCSGLPRATYVLLTVAGILGPSAPRRPMVSTCILPPSVIVASVSEVSIDL